MSTTPQSNKTVVLSLSTDPSSGSDVLFPERHITFHPGKDNIVIGRASKVSVKGYVAGIENAWFHSPVMSRHHAQLFARMDCNKVEIKDLGSLHGTFLNGDERVPDDDFRELKDGDVIRFGAPIWRGTEQFMPTTVKVGLAFPNHDGTSTFQVPDESDDDASDDDRSSDSEIRKPGTKAHRPTAQGTSTLANATVTPTIDLTGEHCGQGSRHVIDLSTPRGSPTRIYEDEDMAGVLENRSDEVEHAVRDHEATIHELAGRADHEDVRDTTGTPDEVVDDPYDSFELEALLPREHDSNSVSAETDDDSHMDDLYEGPTYEQSVHSESTSDEGMDASNDLDGLSSSESVHDSEMDFEDYPSDEGGFDSSSETDWRTRLPQSTELMTFPEIEPLVKSLSQTPVVPAPSQTSFKGNGVASIDWLLNSDKPQPPALMHPQDPSTTAPSPRTAEALGARTGKVDYFLAREQNKLALELQKACARPTSVQDLCNDDEPADESRDYKFGPAAHMSSPQSMVGGVGECSRRTYVGISDIVDMCQPNPSEVGSNRKTELAPPTPPPAEEQHLRSLDHNHELTQNAGITQAAFAAQEEEGLQRSRGGKKRKANDISSTTQEELEWAISAARAAEPAFSNPHEEPVNQLLKASEQGEKSSPISVSQTLERHPKRAKLMRIAERLGYAALGGVTAGAMIVGTLIYTAPTFS
ncbi:hypothetical protein C7999DRAFT_27823 [Corynascus novoguineensis]|uniref:FHA domain-containing protein n=1 Tax=Corynascus novoguineensis TaxID=1126955 RepID=A0AAN7D0I5_9PEZI|nr:hypothetical protein C7999DRAFT_27823 [Corynascus novoguineensis]